MLLEMCALQLNAPWQDGKRSCIHSAHAPSIIVRLPLHQFHAGSLHASQSMTGSNHVHHPYFLGEDGWGKGVMSAP